MQKQNARQPQVGCEHDKNCPRVLNGRACREALQDGSCRCQAMLLSVDVHPSTKDFKLLMRAERGWSDS